MVAGRVECGLSTAWLINSSDDDYCFQCSLRTMNECYGDDEVSEEVLVA